MNQNEKRRTGQIQDVFLRLARNKAAMLGLFILLVMILCAIFAPFVAPYNYAKQDLINSYIPPCLAHPFGTDNLGRDILSRVIYGTRISLLVGICSVCLATVIGVFLGSIAGFYGGVFDNLLMRLMDIVLAVPSLLLAISIASTLGNGIQNLILAIGLGASPVFLYPTAAIVERGSINCLSHQIIRTNYQTLTKTEPIVTNSQCFQPPTVFQ